MAKFDGFLFYMLGSIGTKSEGPDYHLQQFDYKVTRVIKKAELWKEDPILHKYVHQKVAIEGNLMGEDIEYNTITEYKSA
jgi:hypothetical protein